MTGDPCCPVVYVEPAEIVVVTVATIGERGETGPRGLPGTAAQKFVHTQASASTTWTVNHNLAVKPIATVFSPGWLEMDATVLHLDDNTLTVSFNSPTAGFVICQ